MKNKQFQITTPDNYHTSLWKNGKGKTTELAINENGSLENFSFRLSIASVAEDGLFSNFNGLERNLFLLSGEGIELTHTIKSEDSADAKATKATDTLTTLLSYASFNGGSTTHGRLINGGITDFNVIHNPNIHNVEIVTAIQASVIDINACDRCFIYPTKSAITLIDNEAKNKINILGKHLLCLNNPQQGRYNISGSDILIIHFTDIN